MKRQVAKIVNNGIYKVIHDDSAAGNQYTIYKTTSGHQKKLDTRSDIAGCLYYIAEDIINR